MKKTRKESAPSVPDDADPADSTPNASSAAEGGSVPAPDGHPSGAVVEPAEEHIRRLQEELDQVKDKYLRLAAEMENFRRRTAKERTETWARAQADVVANVLDALDDLGRVAHLDPSRTNTEDVLVGVELVERKFLKELEGAGLERVGIVGEAFDPHRHEAVSTVPAATAAQDHTVALVFQPGYRFGGALLRPARVQVQVWQEQAGE
jgi:molecular chaperone GrpE